MFASLNVLKELQKHYENNPKDPLKGIIWHTQGSGKTALTYHLTKLIKDFFSPLGKKTKFYFIVDRLDLLEQAKNEFLKRGLQAHEAENKEDLSQKLKSSSVFENPQGNDEIIVVNIQKFKAPNENSSDSAPKEIISKTDLQESIQNSHDLQRVFIIDEAHRSYDPKGCFYANLIECDKTAIKIALTGTPLLEDNAQDKATKKTFGNYLHTYSYAESIKDGHTLTLQLEIIEKSYKEKLQEIYRLLQESITIKDIEVKKETIFNDEKYIKEMLFYIIRDLLKFRQLNDNNEQLKAMVVCFSSKQAKLANWLFNEVQEEVLQKNPNLKILNKLKSSLILHDEQEVKEKIYSYSAIISQLKQYNQQTTHLLNKYDNDLAYVITHKRLHERLHKRLMEENISDPVGIFTLLSALKSAIDERISKRQEFLNEEYHLKNAIKVELRNAFKENPTLKDLKKEEEFIIQTLFNELQNHHQGNSHAQ
ncbi:hypothetical protein VN1289_12600 [Helicobacter pylori]|nr:hypothetical protein VN1289_12600 [Helicobacter pylori]